MFEIIEGIARNELKSAFTEGTWSCICEESASGYQLGSTMNYKHFILSLDIQNFYPIPDIIFLHVSSI